MEQQQINNEFYPLHDTILESEDSSRSIKERNQLNAQKRQKQLHKYFYTDFTPYQQLFNSRSTHLTLYKSKPKFQLHSHLWDRRRLTLERQSMYYRGAVDEYLTDEALRPFVEESSNEKGFIEKRRNKSVIVGGILYYSHQQCIKAIQIPKCKNQGQIELYHQAILPIEVFKFEKGCIILQIQSLQNHLINVNNQGTILIIRLSRKIIILSVNQTKIIHTLSSQTEFIQINASLYTKNSLQTIEYDDGYSILQLHDLQSKHALKTTVETSIKIKGLINSFINLNRNQTFLSKYDGLSLLDKRVGKEMSLYSVKQLNKQRLYSSVSLKGLYNYSPYIACCQSRYISIFDIRKENLMVEKKLHQSQQSPPEVMSFYDGNSLTPLEKPIITCHSPHQIGSSIFATIDSEGLKYSHHSSSNFNNVFTNSIVNSHFTLLYDEGKSSPGSAFHNSFNESVSVWNYSSQDLCFFNIDNQETINMEYFQNHSSNQRYQIKQFNINKQDSVIIHKNSVNPSELWLEQNLKDKYFIEQNYYQKIQPESIIQSQLPKAKKKATKKMKNKNKNKIQKKLSQINQPLTEIDIQQFIDCEYQNSQECEESFAKRKLNFADLSKFYSTLQTKAIQSKSNHNHDTKHNQLDLSLNSTQPNSEGYIFSQSITDDWGIKTFSFHNKKLMNFSILDKLKNEWDK